MHVFVGDLDDPERATDAVWGTAARRGNGIERGALGGGGQTALWNGKIIQGARIKGVRSLEEGRQYLEEETPTGGLRH